MPLLPERQPVPRSWFPGESLQPGPVNHRSDPVPPWARTDAAANATASTRADATADIANTASNPGTADAEAGAADPDTTAAVSAADSEACAADACVADACAADATAADATAADTTAADATAADATAEAQRSCAECGDRCWCGVGRDCLGAASITTAASSSNRF